MYGTLCILLIIVVLIIALLKNATGGNLTSLVSDPLFECIQLFYGHIESIKIPKDTTNTIYTKNKQMA
jgi:hypothetical protein